MCLSFLCVLFCCLLLDKVVKLVTQLGLLVRLDSVAALSSASVTHKAGQAKQTKQGQTRSFWLTAERAVYECYSCGFCCLSCFCLVFAKSQMLPGRRVADCGALVGWRRGRAGEGSSSFTSAAEIDLFLCCASMTNSMQPGELLYVSMQAVM